MCVDSWGPSCELGIDLTDTNTPQEFYIGPWSEQGKGRGPQASKTLRLLLKVSFMT